MINKKIDFQKKISSLKIQGAQNIAKAILEQVGRWVLQSSATKRGDFWLRGYKESLTLASLRPTEPMARNLVRWYWLQLKKNIKTLSPLKIKAEQNKLLDLVKQADLVATKYGAALLKSGSNIFTHCHSSQVEGVLLTAHHNKKKFIVYHTETRPLFQGRITDKHLRRVGIKTYLVADSAAAWLVSNHSGDDIKINLVLLGADSIERDGSVINKVGSFAIALSAYESGIPVYIVANLLKLDWDKKSVIEIRPSKEIWPTAPAGTKIINYAFDKIPAKFITGLVTEAGIIKSTQVVVVACKQYPKLFF